MTLDADGASFGNVGDSSVLGDMLNAPDPECVAAGITALDSTADSCLVEEGGELIWQTKNTTGALQVVQTGSPSNTNQTLLNVTRFGGSGTFNVSFGGTILTVGTITAAPDTNGVVSAGIPVTVANPVAINNSTSALGTTTVFTTTVTAQYRISINADCHTAVATATVTLTVAYTDSSGTVISTTPTNALCTVLGTSSHTGALITDIVQTGTNITWAIAVANGAHYDARATVEQLTEN